MNAMRFSLVLATMGRDQTVDRFIESVVEQDFQLKEIELIIVDQNEDDRLDSIVYKYSTSDLTVKHIKSSFKGLSFNRNVGLKVACGEIVCFPDDDCEYSSNLLTTVDKIFLDFGAGFVSGRIWDKAKNASAIRNWPEKARVYNRLNFYRMASSITLFAKSNTMRFDERFGLGAKYGSNEDAIYICQMLKNGMHGVYSPNIVVYHDDQPISAVDLKKVASYSRGFGNFIRIYLSPYTFAIFLTSLTYQLIQALVSLCRLRFSDVRLRLLSLLNRIAGLLGVQ